MKFTLLSLFLSPLILFAQTPRVKTGFNSFTEKSSVTWAVYANDTASFSGTGFIDIFLTGYLSGKIPGFIPLENGDAGEDRLLARTAKDLQQLLAPGADTFSVGDHYDIQTKSGDLSARFSSPVFELYRILYIQHGKLLSYITRVSPKTVLVTSNGVALGLLESVSFAVNKHYDAKLRSARKPVFLGKRIAYLLPDSIPPALRVKETFGRNFIETLWPSVLSGKLSIYPEGGSEKITPAQLTSGTYPGAQQIEVAVYDSLGNDIGTRRINYEISPGSFDKVGIIEELYYDPRRNIVLSRIPEVLLFKKTFPDTAKGEPIRLVF